MRLKANASATTRGGASLRRSTALLAAMTLLLAACGGNGSETDDGSGAAGDAEAATDGDGSDEPVEEGEHHLRISTHLAPDSAISDAIVWWADEITERTDGAVTTEIFYGGSLMEGPDAWSGIAEGRAEAAYLVAAHVPSDVPLLNVAMIPGGGQNSEAHARALGQLQENNEHVQEELDGVGVRVNTFLPIGPMSIGTPERVESVDELEGLRVMTLGPVAGAWELRGIEPVQMTSTEVYEAMERGVLDGHSMHPLDTITAQGFHEITPWSLDEGIGLRNGSGAIGMGQETYESFPEDIQQVVDEVSQEAYGAASEILMEYEDASCQTMIDAGGGVTQLPAEESEAWVEDIGESLWETWRSDAATAGASEEAIASVEEDFRRLNEELLSEVTYEDALAICAERTTEAHG